MASKVFISYRREDSKGDARALKQALVQRLPDVEFFMDTDNGIKPGESYVQVLDDRE